jgi:hypothetical protein
VIYYETRVLAQKELQRNEFMPELRRYSKQEKFLLLLLKK